MALGIKSTDKIEEGDVLFANSAVTLYQESTLKTVALESQTGLELGQVYEVTTKYIKVANEYGSFFLKPNVDVSIYANKEFDYSTTPKTVSDPSKSTSGGLVGFLQSLFGFGTEVLKKTSSTTTKDTTGKDTTTGKEVVDPNASGDTPAPATSIWLFVGAGVLLIILLIVIFWKPKPKMATAPPTMDYSPQVIKLS